MNSTPKFAVSPMLNKQRQKEGKYKLFIRVTLDGKRFEVSSNFYVKSTNWDSKLMCVKSFDENASLINSFINKAKMDLDKIFMKLLALDEGITLDKIKSKFLGIDLTKDNIIPKEKTLFDAIEYHNHKMNEMVSINKISKATLARYKMTKNKTLAFLKLRFNQTDLELSKLKLSFITEFEHYLLTIDKLNTNTAHKHIKNLKKIMNIAIGLDWIQINPFTQFKCSYKNPEREILNQQEIFTLQNTHLKYERLEKVRDIFVFCCYTGFAYSDVKAFERNAVILGIDGEYWLTTFRQKTGIKESVPLLPEALKIIEKYQNHPYCVRNNKLLPVNCNQRFNEYLKEIAIHCKINKKLTSHIARHTFATTITLANGVPIETVSSMLGHTSIRTTQIYAKVVEQKVSDDMKLLRQKLTASTKKLKVVG